MLEQLRRSSRSVINWVLFGIIIAAFVLTFGTQSEVSVSGCTGGATGSHVMVVDDQSVSIHAWRLGMNSTQSGLSKLFRSQQVLDRLLEREILAQAAEKAGYRVNNDMASEQIAGGEFYILGGKGDGESFYYRDGAFDYDTLEARVNAWGLPSVGEFIEQQRRELLAQNMRRLILESAAVSPEEVRLRYVQENTKVTLDTIQFRPAEYRSKLNLGDAELDAYLAAHEDEVRKRYEENERTYQGVGKQVKVRQIMFRPQRQAAAEAGETADAVDPGEAAARAAHEKLAAGADFAALAREVSEDERTKVKGGALGWRLLEAPGLGARELGEALKSLQVGGVSDVITTPRGYYILKVEGEREGDLSFDDVKREIAERMAPEHYARQAAERDAKATLARAKAALAEGKALEEVFERQATPPPRPGGMNQNMSPEELQQLIQQLQQQQGSVIVESPNMPAEASLQAGEPAATSAATAGDAPAAAAQAGAGQATGTGRGDAAAAAAGGAAGDAASSDAVPVTAGLVEPKLRQVGPITRDAEGNISTVGRSDELMKAAFDELEQGQLAGQVYEVGDNFVIVQLVSREEANLEELEENLEQKTEDLSLERGYRLYSNWLKERCAALYKDQAIGINASLMDQLAGTEEQKFSYRPFCAE